MASIKSSVVCSPTTATSKKSAWTKLSGSPTKPRAKPSQLVTTFTNANSVPSLKTTFTSPHRLQNIPGSRDIAILHESRIFQTLLAAAAANNKLKTEVKTGERPSTAIDRSPVKRDPILQNNEEQTHVFRPSVKRLASSDRLSPCGNEVISRSRATGEFNHIYNPQAQEAQPSGIKTFVIMPSESQDERRARMAVRTRSAFGGRNPIIEGDESNSIIRRSKKAGDGLDIDHQKKMNDKKYLLPADRGTSPRGRVFTDTTANVVGTDYALENRLRVEPTGRPMSAMEEKMRGSIKGVMEYDEGPRYKDNGITGKCTNMSFVDMTSGRDTERIFARKATLK